MFKKGMAMLLALLGVPALVWVAVNAMMASELKPYQKRMVERLNNPKERIVPIADISNLVRKESQIIVNSVGMRFVYIDPGTFMMGSPEEEHKPYRIENEYQHEVAITKGFFLGETEVTQGQWKAVMGTEPEIYYDFEGAHWAVQRVSWNEAQEFVRRLNELEGNNLYRLPTEAEWEYACRAGTQTSYWTGDRITSDLENIGGWIHNDDSQYWQEKIRPHGKPTAVGSYPANPWGLYDMHGNISEWTQDWYAEDYYQNSPKKDPQGPDTGEVRVLRGGSWTHSASLVRSASRFGYEPDIKPYDAGLRVVRMAP